jgi:hypothetical protein
MSWLYFICSSLLHKDQEIQMFSNGESSSQWMRVCTTGVTAMYAFWRAVPQPVVRALYWRMVHDAGKSRISIRIGFYCNNFLKRNLIAFHAFIFDKYCPNVSSWKNNSANRSWWSSWILVLTKQLRSKRAAMHFSSPKWRVQSISWV